MLLGPEIDRVRLARVSNDGLGPEAERAGGRNESVTPAAVAVAVALERDGGRCEDIIRLLQVRHARGMDIEHDDHGCGLPEVICHLAADANPHGDSCRLEAARSDPTAK